MDIGLFAVTFGYDLYAYYLVEFTGHKVVDGAEAFFPVHTHDCHEVVHGGVGVVAQLDGGVVPLFFGDSHHRNGVALDLSLREELAYLVVDCCHNAVMGQSA